MLWDRGYSAITARDTTWVARGANVPPICVVINNAHKKIGVAQLRKHISEHPDLTVVIIGCVTKSVSDLADCVPWRLLRGHEPLVDHPLVPKHEICPPDDRPDVAPVDLPIITPDDPVSVYYGFKADQIIRITRTSLDGFEYFYYRRVSSTYGLKKKRRRR